ncbi:MAG: acetoacetate--CoA ligase [Thaumarchaeota archaeon]|nr:acetoacetate--CoA ligase [Nitrososphaerota archaeon]
MASDGKAPLWEPDEKRKAETNVARFAESLGKTALGASEYDQLWRWSVEDLEGFWGAVWSHHRLKSSAPYARVLRERKMPGAVWFEGTRLNYAERVLNAADGPGPALMSLNEAGEVREMSWQELRRQVSSVAAWLKDAGVGRGDRVAAYASNVPEALVSFLAAASIGAVWSSCSLDFGAPSVKDRFSQIAPKVLVASTSYSYGGRLFERGEGVAEVAASLPSLERTVILPGGRAPSSLKGAADWDELLGRGSAQTFEQVPFDHPLWILYSSWTTGLPKPIVHGHGGILVEHLKALSLHNDVRPSDRFFWYTTTGWMMWNYLVGGLLLGATVVLYDGSPSYPDANALWTLAERTGASILGTSAAHLGLCMKAGVSPRSTHRLSALRCIGSTGSPLSPEAFSWVYAEAKDDVWLASISGGTDLCTAFVGGCPVLPVYAGEIQCRCLGAKVEAFDEKGASVVGKTGERVLTEPLPSMPLYFWGDPDGARYRESYFDDFPGVWRHGDWFEVTPRGTCIIHGRSDATIKRMGVRIGTGEIYRVVEALPEVADSLAVDLGSGGQGDVLLFVCLRQGVKMDDDLERRIKEKVRRDLSPRHVPDRVVEAPSIPRTINGKKLEVPIKRILLGADPMKAVNIGSLADPQSVDYYSRLAKTIAVGGKV